MTLHVRVDVWDCPVPQPYPRKAVRVHHGMSKPWSFIKVRIMYRLYIIYIEFVSVLYTLYVGHPSA